MGRLPVYCIIVFWSESKQKSIMSPINNQSIATFQVCIPSGTSIAVSVEWDGEFGISFVCSEVIEAETHAAIQYIWQCLQDAAIPGLLDIIPAYHTITILFDPEIWNNRSQGASLSLTLIPALLQQLQTPSNLVNSVARKISIPVCYDVSMAPDLYTLADWVGCTPEEVIALHVNTSYSVYMLGFLPGFAYMGTVDARIAAPRHQRPRKNVAPGSVGIAAQQTGIYPTASPGGWQLIGRTPLRMWMPEQSNPCFLQPGDAVQFYPISLNEFHQLASA
ncbi:MAG: 5-oxoprolinase subunit PxpB [Sediminibacterium sp.]|nr:5-oxoprolinase subunit PxpB [Sediminibacterium sp.]